MYFFFVLFQTSRQNRTLAQWLNCLVCYFLAQHKNNSFFIFRSRTYRRYFYFNETTGETRWEYPEETSEVSMEPHPPSYPPPGQEAAHNLRKEGSEWPPPGVEIPEQRVGKGHKKKTVS